MSPEEMSAAEKLFAYVLEHSLSLPIAERVEILKALAKLVSPELALEISRLVEDLERLEVRQRELLLNL